MTKSRNFPGNKHFRRLSALQRLKTNLSNTQVNTENIGEINRMKEEISTLESRVGGGGKKSTKKVHANSGRK